MERSAKLSEKENRDFLNETLRDFFGLMEPASDQTEYAPTTISRLFKKLNSLDLGGPLKTSSNKSLAAPCTDTSTHILSLEEQAELQEEAEIVSLKLELEKVKAAMEENKAVIKQLDIKILNMMTKFQKFLNEISKEKEELMAENQKLKKALVKKEELKAENQKLKRDLALVKKDLDSNNLLKKGDQMIKEKEAEKLRKMIENKETSIAKQEMELVNAKRFKRTREKQN